MDRWPDYTAINLSEFHAALREAQTAQDCETVLLNHIACLGYDTWLLGAVKVSEDGRFDRVFVRSNMKAGVIEKYRHTSADDATAIHCTRSGEPLLWSTVHEGEQTGVYTDAQHAVGQSFITAGYSVGVTIPLHITRGIHFYGMSFCREGATHFAGHDKMFAVHGNDLIAVAHLYFDYFDFFDVFKEEYRLTPAELDVLVRTFYYITNANVGKARKSSGDTVRKQWENILRKLKVGSREEAQQIAVGFGLHVKQYPEDAA